MNNYIEEAIAALLMGKHSLPYVRSNAVDDIAVKLKDMWSGVYLVEGRPGIGKSAAMQYLSAIVEARNPGRVVSYYFSRTDPVLDNAENFYSYACEKIRILANGDSGDQTTTAKYNRKYSADFYRAVSELSASIGGEEERRVYVFIDGIEEMQGYKEFLWRFPYAEGVVYVIFAQPGICDGAFPDRFYERGKIKDKVELKYCDRTQAKLLFWEAFGKEADSSMDEFESRVSSHLESYIGIEENRYPLLLRFLAEDAAKRDGFNPDRAWTNGLEKYVDERISRLAEDNDHNFNAQNILALAALAYGPLQPEDFCEILGLKPAVCEAALKDAKRFLVFAGKGIVIFHNALASLISKKWTSKANYEAYLNWGANWQNPKLRPSAAEYIARYYVFHILDYAESQPDGYKRAGELLLTLYSDDLPPFTGPLLGC